MERAVDAVRGALDDTRAEARALTASVAARRVELLEQSKALEETEGVRAALAEKLGRYRGDIAARGSEVEVREGRGWWGVGAAVTVRCLTCLPLLLLSPPPLQDVDRSLRSEKATHRDLLERRVELQVRCCCAMGGQAGQEESLESCSCPPLPRAV